MDYKRVWAEINLDHLAFNFQALRARVPGRVKLMAIVKADAYGHGAAEAARTLLYSGADALGVASCEEGAALRKHYIEAPILVMGYTPPEMLDEIVKHRLTQTVFDAGTARLLSDTAARMGTKAGVHIKVDTGMGRLGFTPDAGSAKAAAEIAQNARLDITGVYTHCATSDAPGNGFIFKQLERFQHFLTEVEKRGLRVPVRHMANSGALAQIATGGLDDSFLFDMARTGILLYGLLPSGEMKDICRPLGLKPVMRLVTQVGMVKTLPAGSGVSYGHMFVTERDTRIATLPVGYADGYPRRLSNKARVLVAGKSVPVVGAVCMDQCMIDVTDAPEVKPGDEVVLMGGGSANDASLDEISADTLADLVGTIGYELVCGISKRVPRVYIRDKKIIKTVRMV